MPTSKVKDMPPQYPGFPYETSVEREKAKFRFIVYLQLSDYLYLFILPGLQ